MNQQGSGSPPLSTRSSLSDTPTETTPLIDDRLKYAHESASKYSEFRWLFFNSLPTVGTYFLQSSLQLASVFTLGHMGSTELAAAALSTMFANVTAWSVAFGAATALDTLCSQAWTGAHDKTLVGVHLQRSLVILSLMFVPIACIWWKAADILIALRQEPELAYHAGLFLRYLIIGAPAFIAFETIKKYLQAQGIMKASTYVLMIASPVNLVINYLLVHVEPFRIGFIGAPLATSFSYWLMLILILFYVKYINGWQAWGGWSRECLTGWWAFLRLAIPGIFMVCSEWWAFELAALAASYLGSVKLAAQSILLTTASATYTIPFGISVAASNRVGNAVGEGRPLKAKTAADMALVFAIVMAGVNSAFFMITRNSFGYLFTSEPDVVETVSRMIPLCAAFQVADGLAGVSNGIFRGLGRQKIAAWINLIAYYIITLPLAYVLTFRFDWDLIGIWLGLSVALYLAAIGEVVYLRRLDWDREVRQILRRLYGFEHGHHNA